MQIAGVDVYVNHPVLALGSTDWLPVLSLEEEPAVSCDTHVAVRVKAQVQLIKVRVFAEPIDEGPGPDDSFVTVFDGPLALADGRLVIGDVMGETRFVKLIGEQGRRWVRVAVNAGSFQSPGERVSPQVTAMQGSMLGRHERIEAPVERGDLPKSP